jgi:nicotinamide mononucleotide transporter
MQDILQHIWSAFTQQSMIEFIGLITGVISGILLIKNKILTWPIGIVFVLSTLYITWSAALYGDFILYIVFLFQYIYGWMSWSGGENNSENQLSISLSTTKETLILIGLSVIGIYFFALFIIWLPDQISGMAPASLPYWDSTTSILMVAAMYLIAKRRIDNWYYLFVVDVLATGIFFYKGYYYFSLLYLIYIGFAIWGYLSWKKIQSVQ